jgi:hypothetical protein
MGTRHVPYHLHAPEDLITEVTPHFPISSFRQTETHKNIANGQMFENVLLG